MRVNELCDRSVCAWTEKHLFVRELAAGIEKPVQFLDLTGNYKCVLTCICPSNFWHKTIVKSLKSLKNAVTSREPLEVI